ncbi:ABC transporter ATP-binding protein [Pseudonocardia pini]|uniref:ABC transporter ATP-binding protein n=1 Tax=Pseudonocardia pini TaxID=2758030 RepID=UPI0015F062B7|nr:ATP-binding cassette domain-containing protein [Pseudonocardia pini]
MTDETSGSRPLLAASGLCKDYGGVRAVRDVSFELGRGEVLGLIGPNGAGKTTLVDLLSGVQRDDGGSVLVDGRPVGRAAFRRARSGFARTFQHPQLALGLTVRQNILLGRTARTDHGLWRMVTGPVRGALRPRGPADDRLVATLLAEVGLDRPDRRAGDLTLGEQRLVEVARALAQDPLVLLLDEPFAGADASGVAGIARAVRVVRDRGCGVILVDHNVDLVAELTDRLVLLADGAVAFDGAPADCLSSPEMNAVYFGSEAAS